MKMIHGVEFEDAVVEKERIIKTLDAQSPLEKWVLAHTRLSLRGLRLLLGTLSALFFVTTAILLFLAYYLESRLNQ